MAKKIVGVIIIFVLGGLFYLWHRSVIKRMEMVYQKEMNNLKLKLQKEYEVDFFKVYSYNPINDSVEIDFYIKIPKHLPLETKLRIITDRLSRFEFQRHPINFLRVENRKGKKIAIVDLKEPDYSHAFTWRGGFFQGSSGGLSTTITLVKTFLQPDYQGEWIDGIEFYYEGEPISNEWDHIRLNGTIYR
ncbi:MAG: hypothetical protein ABIL18_02130 [candidate division WOR-3 bacterium]